MTDLLHVLPDFSTKPFSNLLPSLERSQITVSDILTSDAVDLAKRASLPAREVKRLHDALLQAFHLQLGLANDFRAAVPTEEDGRDEQDHKDSDSLMTSGTELERQWKTISTLDEGLDAALSGGIPAGYLTEITGESGVGKTQFLLTLLLAVQLSTPIGFGQSALYISTEAPLQTQRLTQLLSAHPQLRDLHEDDKPTLSRIHSIQTPDLESQEHILRYQVPVAIRRYNVGLIIIDSITANFRAEFDASAKTPGGHSGTRNQGAGAALMQRTLQLQTLGALLRDLARTHNVAIVVANQVADRFHPEPPSSFAMNPATPAPYRMPPSSNPAAISTTLPQTPRPRSPMPPSASAPPNATGYPFPAHGQPQTQQEQPSHQAQQQLQDYPLTLEHQQRFFTGWGDIPPSLHSDHNLKTPSLGLVWTNQIACRIALIKKQSRPSAAMMREVRLAPGGRDDYRLLNAQRDGQEGDGGGGASRWRRYFRVAFSAWAEAVDGEEGVEVEIGKEGLRSVRS